MAGPSARRCMSCAAMLLLLVRELAAAVPDRTLQPLGEPAGGRKHRVRVAAETFIANRDKASAEELGRLLRDTPELQPRMMLSQGCSGSSELVRELVDHLRAQGLQTMHFDAADTCLPHRAYAQAGAVQLTRRAQNHCRVSTEPSTAIAFGVEPATAAELCRVANDNTSLALMLVTAHAAANGKAAVFKGRAKYDMKAMRLLGTRAAIFFRDNTLARIICMARDCFGEFDDGLTKGVAINVGPNADACFERRHLAAEQQTQVRINTTLLLPELRRVHATVDHMVAMMLSGGWAHEEVQVISVEDLHSSQGNASEAAFNRSLSAWSAALTGMGVTGPDPDVIAATLAGSRGACPAHACRDALDNAAEVEAVLEKAGGPFARMSHDG